MKTSNLTLERFGWNSRRNIPQLYFYSSEEGEVEHFNLSWDVMNETDDDYRTLWVLYNDGNRVFYREPESMALVFLRSMIKPRKLQVFINGEPVVIRFSIEQVEEIEYVAGCIENEVR